MFNNRLLRPMPIAMAQLKIFDLLFISYAFTLLFKTSATSLSCSALKELFESRGLNGSAVPSKPRKGERRPKVWLLTCFLVLLTTDR